MLLSQVIDDFKLNINKARTYQGGIVLVEPRKVREVKSLLCKEVDVKESYIGTIQDFFLTEIINEFAYAVDDEICCRNFVLVEDDGVSTITDYLKRGEVHIKRFTEAVLLCLSQADKYLTAKYKFLIANTKIDDKILTAISSLGIQILYWKQKADELKL